jgi:hypothetical protein
VLADAADLLAGMPCAEGLRAFTLLAKRDQTGPPDAAQLSAWRFPNLTWLRLNFADDAVVRALASLPFAPNLRVLDLLAHRLTPAGMEVLAGGRFAGLVWLGLWNGPVCEERTRALGASPGLPDLRYLDLHGVRAAPEALNALAASPHLPRLEAVSVGQYQPEPFPPEWACRYAHRFVLPPPPLGFLSSR